MSGATEKARALPMVPVTEEVLSFDAFLKAWDRSRTNIERTQVIAPSLNDSHFGAVRVWYKQPVFRAVNVFKRRRRRA